MTKFKGTEPQGKQINATQKSLPERYMKLQFALFFIQFEECEQTCEAISRASKDQEPWKRFQIACVYGTKAKPDGFRKEIGNLMDLDIYAKFGWF